MDQNRFVPDEKIEIVRETANSKKELRKLADDLSSRIKTECLGVIWKQFLKML